MGFRIGLRILKAAANATHGRAEHLIILQPLAAICDHVFQNLGWKRQAAVRKKGAQSHQLRPGVRSATPAHRIMHSSHEKFRFHTRRRSCAQTAPAQSVPLILTAFVVSAVARSIIIIIPTPLVATERHIA